MSRPVHAHALLVLVVSLVAPAAAAAQSAAPPVARPVARPVAQSVALTVAPPVVPPGPTGSVTIGLAEYNDLLDRIARPPMRPETVPVPAVVSRAAIAVRINDDLARGTITLQGEVLRAGPAVVPLLAGGIVLDARMNGQTVALMQDKGGHAAVLADRGPFSVVVTWVSPVMTEPGRATILLPVIVAGSLRATIDAAGEGTDLRLDPAVVTQRTSAGGRATVEATLASGVPTRVTWSSRDPQPAPAQRALRLLSDVKSLVTVGEHELRVASLVDVTVVQGTAATLRVRVPDGFELASVSGASIEVASEQPGLVDLTILPGDRRRHQFLVTIERGTPDTTRKATVPLPWLDGSQRETGEVAVEGVGALDLTLDDQPALTRIDVGEVAPALQALAREPLLAASRYHRRAPEAVTLALGIVRFPDAPVLTAVADRAVATTLVTTEGRALTEVMLTVRNQAQPFLKVGLPTGATLLSAEVGGTAVKPAHGVDGTRVPLLRPGLQTREPYRVSFIYLHTGTPFANKGDAQLSLARVDVPIAWLEWEVFLPDRVEVARFSGVAFDRALVDVYASIDRDEERAAVGGLAETVTVVTESPRKELDRLRQANEPSMNVQNLQRRVAGILPVRMDVPRAGRSHSFVRPLVLDEETEVGFKYRRR